MKSRWFRNFRGWIALALATSVGFCDQVSLSVKPGTPLPVYLTRRVFYKLNAPVTARFVSPVWTYDRISIPADATASGSIVQLDPVPRMVRFMSMVRGDFTPLKRAEIRFRSITFPDGRTMNISTEPSEARGGIYIVHKSKNSIGRVFESVRAPGRKEWVENFLLSKLPYHPQWFRRGERFDAVLSEPIPFGTTEVANASAEPAPGQKAVLRLTTGVSSLDAVPGTPIHAVLSEPMFSTDHRLVLPEGAELSGKVTLAKRARYFHRNGKLRFVFTALEVPDATAQVHAQLDSVEQSGTNIAVDEEGTAKATESKTRLLRPLIAGLVAAKSLDNDAGKAQSDSVDPNYSGRAGGGFSGFGLFGVALTRAPKQVGSALGFYGLAWSVYSTVISRGREVTFPKNTTARITFGSR